MSHSLKHVNLSSLESEVCDMKQHPISIVIPTHNRKEKLVRLIQTVLDSDYGNDKLEIVVIDDASTDGTLEFISAAFPRVRVVRNVNERWVSSCRNTGARNSSNDFILFLDDDNIIKKNMISELVKGMEMLPHAGVIGPVGVYYKTDVIWSAGSFHNMLTGKTNSPFAGRPIREIEGYQYFEVDDIPNCMLVRKDIMFSRSVFFNEHSFPIHMEESDFCARIRQLGYQIVIWPKAITWHDLRSDTIPGMDGGTRSYYFCRNKLLFHRKYSNKLTFSLFVIFFIWLDVLLRISLIVTIEDRDRRVLILRSLLSGILSGLAGSLFSSPSEI